MKIEQKLEELNIGLPQSASPVGAYIPAVQSGSLVFVSGQLPVFDGKLMFLGKVGGQVSLEQAGQASVIACKNALAAVKALVGSLDNVTGVVKIEVFVASAEGFIDQAKVANPASELLHKVFGPAGQHARVAVGVAELPLNSPVEISFIFEVK